MWSKFIVHSYLNLNLCIFFLFVQKSFDPMVACYLISVSWRRQWGVLSKLKFQKIVPCFLPTNCRSHRTSVCALNMSQFSLIWAYFDYKYWYDSWIKILFKEFLKRKKKVSVLLLFIHRVVKCEAPNLQNWPIPKTLLTILNQSPVGSVENLLEGECVLACWTFDLLLLGSERDSVLFQEVRSELRLQE